MMGVKPNIEFDVPLFTPGAAQDPFLEIIDDGRLRQPGKAEFLLYQ